MTEKTYDVLVVGGGITGACILRDAALRGLSAALIEAQDFSNATSSATSKLVHGGLRYLKNLEFGLIRESLKERRVWERLAPHLVYPLPFLLPFYQGGDTSRLTLSLGMVLYDALSFDKGWLDDPDQRIPNHSGLKAAEAAAREPVLNAPGLTGALLYYDCQMYAPERLGLECIKDAMALGADAANYARLIAFERTKGRIEGARIEDTLTGQTHAIKARTIVNATGPWADHVLALAQEGTPSRHLIRAKGIHLIVRPLTNTHAITGMHKGGHFFVLPWRGHSILGTTDSVHEGPPEDVCVTEHDITSFLAFVNDGLPGARLTRDDVVHTYVGLRPLVDDGSKDSKDGKSYGASRRAEICDHAHEGAEGLFSAIGGKWTTSRHIAERMVDRLVKALDKTAGPCTTATTPLGAGRIGRFRNFLTDQRLRMDGMPSAAVENLARNYGAHIDAVIAAADQRRALLNEPLSDRLPDVGAEIVHAARNEMAMTLEDAIFRRTGMGTLGHPGAQAVERAGALMAKERGWTASDLTREIERVERRFKATRAMRA